LQITFLYFASLAVFIRLVFDFFFCYASFGGGEQVPTVSTISQTPESIRVLSCSREILKSKYLKEEIISTYLSHLKQYDSSENLNLK
jgi:hypothetical protein